MRVGIIGSICFLALLLSVRTEDLEKSSREDLTPAVSESVSTVVVSSEDDESRSGAMAESSAFSDGGSALSEAKADSNGGSSVAQSSALAGMGGSAVSKAQASSVAQSDNMGLGMMGSPLRMQPASPYVPVPISDQLYPYGQGSLSQAEANARAKANTVGYSPSVSMINPYSGVNQYDPRVNLYNMGLNSYTVQPSYSPSSSASAKAEATANSGGSGVYNPRQNLYDLFSPYGSQIPMNTMNSGSSSASAQAEANANNVGNRFPLGPYSSGPLSQDSSAQAVAEAVAGGRPISFLPFSGQSSPDAQAQAIAQASVNSAASASANAFAEANARLMMPSEYIYPNQLPGSNVITCTRAHDFYYLWTAQLQCLVCMCVEEYNRLTPVCVSCAGCMNEPNPPAPPSPPEPITVYPDPYPVVPTTAPNDVTCRPLPSGQPFTNPLNPCQMCICQETIDYLGRPDVQIDCQENPQCVIPPDVTTMIPDVPVPVPLPLCEKFPPNVLFPHPTDMCKICKCSVGITEYGMPEQAITCFPNPDCVPQPYTTPAPFPDIVTVVPWPPTPTTPAPLPPGPLPGPSPHESCRPFQPNVPFQHPWDDCQVCVCTESFAIGLITVEVNCFTKQSCCVEPPEPFGPMTLPPPVPAPYPYVPGKIVIKDQICLLKSFDVEFVHPDDSCQVCVCVLANSIVTSVCRPSPDCSVVYPGGGSSASANAEAIASGNNVQVPMGGGDVMPSSVLPFMSGGSQGQATAEANAVAYQPGGMRGLYPGGGMNTASADAVAQALAQGNAQANAQADATSSGGAGYNQYLGNMNMDYMYPNKMNMGNMFSNKMNMGNMYSNQMNMDNMYPNRMNMDNMYPNRMNMDNLYTNRMNLDNMLLNNLNMNNMYPGKMNLDTHPVNMDIDNMYPGNMNSGNLYPVNGGYGGQSGIATADAKAQALMNGIAGGYADAKAQALSNVLSGLSSNYNPYNMQGMPASGMFPGMYTRPSKVVTPLYMPNGMNVDPSSSSAQASAQSVASGSNAQSQASASAVAGGNKYFGKSGQPESLEED